MNKCLYCYSTLAEGEEDFHKSCALEFFGTAAAPKLSYTIDQMTDLAKEVVERSVAVPGVQPKLSMSLVNEGGETTDNRLTVIDALDGFYILKPPSDVYPELPANEHLTMKIAQLFGIKVVPSSLIRLASSELSYITKRIDRTENGEKIHMIDMFQITEAFDKYRGSLEKIGKALDSYSTNTLLDKTYFFDMVLFSFLTGNSDMHLKNYSMIESGSGWSLAPAYDLLSVAIAMPEDIEETALTLAGKKKKLSKNEFENLGKTLGLTNKQIGAAFNRLYKNKAKAFDLISSSFLSEEMKLAYIELMKGRYDRLGLN